MAATITLKIVIGIEQANCLFRFWRNDEQCGNEKGWLFKMTIDRNVIAQHQQQQQRIMNENSKPKPIDKFVCDLIEMNMNWKDKTWAEIIIVTSYSLISMINCVLFGMNVCCVDVMNV